MANETMAVCKRGHTVSHDVIDPGKRLAHSRDRSNVVRQTSFAVGGFAETVEVDGYCATCSAPVITACEGCGAAIPRLDLLHGERDPKPFCTRCGGPFPWATREQRIGALLNFLDFEDSLSEAGRLQVVEAIAVLSEPEDETDFGDPRRVRAGETIKRLAPKAWLSAQPVLVATLSAALQKALGLG